MGANFGQLFFAGLVVGVLLQISVLGLGLLVCKGFIDLSLAITLFLVVLVLFATWLANSLR